MARAGASRHDGSSLALDLQMKPITGGCACGAIRYEVTAEPIVTFNCHCRDCQKTTGGGYTPVFYVPVNAFKITRGTPKYFGTTSEMMATTCAVFVRNADRDCLGERAVSDKALRMIRVCTNRSTKSGRPTRNLGALWILNCRSSRNTRRGNERISARIRFGRSGRR